MLPIKKIRKNFSRDLRIYSVIGGFPLLVGPLEQDSTIRYYPCGQNGEAETSGCVAQPLVPFIKFLTYLYVEFYFSWLLLCLE